MTTRYMRALGCLLGLLLLLGSTGCGTPPEGIALEIDKQYLEKITRLKLWVITTKLKDGSDTTCQSILEKKAAFDPAKFSVETEQNINADIERQNVELDKLKLGAKIFVAGGYADGDTDDAPQLMGCQQTTIEAGKKAFVSIVLIPAK